MNENINQTDHLKSKAVGMWYGFFAFALWGILPIYWKYLKQVPAVEILAHRIIWSFVFVLFLAAINKRLGDVKAIFLDKKKRVTVFLCAIFITINWGLYIWSVNSNHIIDASLGYYINPLIVTFLGMVVLKEKLNKLQYGALFLATVGVLILTIEYGKFPWISIVLAASFGIYGLFKKLLDVDSIVGLTLETAVLLPIAVIYVLVLQMKGVGALGQVSLFQMLLILLSGVVTATPLIWFAQATRRIDLSAVGFLQYVSPSISLLIGIFVYKEVFNRAHMISFAFIWAALVLYTFSHAGGFAKKSKSIELES